MKKMQELLDKSDDQLESRLPEIDKELFNLRNELKINHKLEKPHLLRALKKERARILTIQTIRKGK
ncbi:MAG: 50S ribosomal protein L29 [Parachlamydiales bacterium]|nr:50S ribosomal protein L29 [Parachlamydiales bacterium]